jgi:hypothetical protein
MPQDAPHRSRLGFLQTSRDRLSERLSALNRALAMEVQHLRREVIAARDLLGDGETNSDPAEQGETADAATREREDVKRLVQRAAASSAKGREVRGLVGQIEEVEARIARIDGEIALLTRRS